MATHLKVLFGIIFEIDINESQLAHCKGCKQILSRGNPSNPRQYSTSGLIYHHKCKHPIEYKEYIAETSKKESRESESTFSTAGDVLTDTVRAFCQRTHKS